MLLMWHRELMIGARAIEMLPGAGSAEQEVDESSGEGAPDRRLEVMTMQPSKAIVLAGDLPERQPTRLR
jgi:hypothetical protein